MQEAEQRVGEWEEERRSRQAAARQAAQAAVVLLHADAAELQQCCRSLESWLAAKRQDLVLHDSQTNLLNGEGDWWLPPAWTDYSSCVASGVMMGDLT